MQRQLLQIADRIPDDIVLTLLKSFAKILSREPEPAPRTPFLRAFAKIRDDDKQFSVHSEDEENLVREYDSGNEVETFNFKVTTRTAETAYSVGGNIADGEQMATIDESTEAEALTDQQDGHEIIPSIDNNLETIDEGIEVEMPALLPADEASADEAFEQIVDGQIEIVNGEAVEEPTVENVSEKTANEDQASTEPPPVDEPAESQPEGVVEPEEPIPTEIEKVSLDDIQREIQEMQAFLMQKGVSPGKKKNKKDETVEEVANQDPSTIEDAYKVDVCIKLKNKNHSHKKHHHSKYTRSENYKEEIIKDGPIFDPTVPNTQEDFMKVKSVSEKIHKKKQKVQPLDVSWQNLVENQKRNYKWAKDFSEISYWHWNEKLFTPGTRASIRRRRTSSSSKKTSNSINSFMGLWRKRKLRPSKISAP